MTMPPATGSEPPERLVPLPRATKWQPLLVTEAHERDHFLRSFRHSHGERRRAKRGQPVAFIRGELLRLRQEPFRRKDASETMKAWRKWQHEGGANSSRCAPSGE